MWCEHFKQMPQTKFFQTKSPPIIHEWVNVSTANEMFIPEAWQLSFLTLYLRVERRYRDHWTKKVSWDQKNEIGSSIEYNRIYWRG